MPLESGSEQLESDMDTSSGSRRQFKVEEKRSGSEPARVDVWESKKRRESIWLLFEDEEESLRQGLRRGIGGVQTVLLLIVGKSEARHVLVDD